MVINCQKEHSKSSWRTSHARAGEAVFALFTISQSSTGRLAILYYKEKYSEAVPQLEELLLFFPEILTTQFSYTLHQL